MATEVIDRGNPNRWAEHRPTRTEASLIDGLLQYDGEQRTPEDVLKARRLPEEGVRVTLRRWCRWGWVRWPGGEVLKARIIDQEAMSAASAAWSLRG